MADQENAPSGETPASQPPPAVSEQQPPAQSGPPPAQQPPPTAQPGAPYPGQPTQPPYPGQPAHVAAPGPPPYYGGQQPQAGYPPQAAGYPPPPPGPQPARGYPPGFGGPLAQNLPQQPQQVQWMTAPTDAPSGCPPGLEYLTHIDQLLVHQQIEIFEMITNFETQNRYRIRNTLGQQIYFAAEESSVVQRQFCGPGRAFQMSITDNTNKEVIRLDRPLRYYCNCSGLSCFCCCSCCLPNIIEVQAPPGNVVGFVKQDPTGIIRPWFSIQDAEGETVLKIKGPVLGCACYADANFEVLSADGQTNVGRISKQWGGLAREYFTDADNFGIQFPMDLDVKMKAVMLGAVFLIDFMFFETAGGNANNRRRRHY